MQRLSRSQFRCPAVVVGKGHDRVSHARRRLPRSAVVVVFINAADERRRSRRIFSPHTWRWGYRWSDRRRRDSKVEGAVEASRTTSVGLTTMACLQRRRPPQRIALRNRAISDLAFWDNMCDVVLPFTFPYALHHLLLRSTRRTGSPRCVLRWVGESDEHPR